MARRIGAPWGCWPHEADPRTGTVEGLRNISFRRRSRIDPQRRRSARLTYLGVPLSTTNDDLARTEAPTAGAPSTEAPNIPPTFAALGVANPIVEALAEHGITTAFPIQEMCLGLALEGRDVIGQAKTGTGKTLGFGIPLLQRIAAPATDAYAQLPTDAVGKPQALIVCPTRELALQVSTDLQQAGKKLGVRVLSVYGGRAYEPQIDALRAGVDVIVGTPGRIIDLATRGDLDLSHVRELVLWVHRLRQRHLQPGRRPDQWLRVQLHGPGPRAVQRARRRLRHPDRRGLRLHERRRSLRRLRPLRARDGVELALRGQRVPGHRLRPGHERLQPRRRRRL